MSRNARVALPEAEYLVLIGRVAYMVSSLEWTIPGDLPGLAQYLPTELTASALAGKSAGYPSSSSGFRQRLGSRRIGSVRVFSCL
jgi:hypothetical protein